jgi:hypothetical protein
MEYVPNITDPKPVSTSSTVAFKEFSKMKHDQEHEKDAPVPYDKAGFLSDTKLSYDITSDEPKPDDNIRDVNGVFLCNQEHRDTRVYPRKNSSVCWWDGHPFDTKPVFIPKRILEDGTYSVYGNFCSPECAMSYLWNEGDIDNETRWERGALIGEMTRKVFNGKCNKIREALPRWALKEYGGEFTIDEFRKINTHPDSEHTTYYPPVTADIPIVRVKNVPSRPPVAVSSRVVIHDERIRKAEKNLLDKSRKATASTQLEGSIRNDAVIGKKRPTGGLASMMNIRVVESPTVST